MEPPFIVTKRIRPLPRVPPMAVDYQVPIRSHSDSQLVPKRRPLPEPPIESSVPPPYSKSSSSPTISVTPPTPPCDPSSSFQPSPHPQRPKGLLKVQTSPAVLLSPVNEDAEDAECSPLTPAIPQVPSPITARRRRISKLRRQLGAGVPSELIIECSTKQPQWIPPPVTMKAMEMEDTDGDESESDEDIPWSVSPDTPAFKIIEHSEGNESTEKIHAPWATALRTYAPIAQRRPTIKKWVWDKAGQRRDEGDYAQIIQQLRKL